jgi:hypothetical protein
MNNKLDEFGIPVKNGIVLFYLLMLVFHIAHVFEEIWGRFWILNRIGLGWFLSINWILICIPMALLYFVLNQKRWAYKLSIIYAGIMGLQGIGHNIMTLATGDYFNGFAGGYSGLGMLLISIPLIYYLRKGMPIA